MTAFYEINEAVFQQVAVQSVTGTPVNVAAPLNGAQVLVRNRGTTTARTVYDRPNGTPLAQPLTTVNGRVEGYVAGEAPVDLVVNPGLSNSYIQPWTPPQKGDATLDDIRAEDFPLVVPEVDDTGRLQRALSAATGRRLRLGVTPYSISGTLVVPTGTDVYGAGRATVRASSSMASTASMFVNPGGTGQADITLDGVEIDANRANRAAGSISAVEFRGTPTAPAARIRIEKCHIHGSIGPSVAFQNVDWLWVVDNIVGDSGRDGILLQAGCRHAEVARNFIYDCDDDHIGAHSGPQSTLQSSDITIADNILNCDGSTSGHGIAINGADRFTVEGNIVWRAFGAGILATNHDAFELRRGMIADNVVIDSGYVSAGNGEGYGIQFGVPALGTDYYSTTAIANVSNIGIIGNIVVGSLRDGIRLRSGSAVSAIRVMDNDSVSNGGYGFVINGQSGLTVAFNDFRNNTSGAISGTKAAGDVYFANKGDIPAITGSRGGNAALASLLTSLSAAGVITDSTTA